jgi:GH15 family glucan-1,4-alpha-glucosidase
MSGYQPIADYGIIGDLHTAAMVASNGSIDWWCPQRFDSPALFAALLDHRRGGSWRISPAGESTSELAYLPATNVLTSTFNVEAGGLIRVTDFMPVGADRRGHSAIYRRVEGCRGSVPVVVRLEPRFNYGVRAARFQQRKSGLLLSDGQGEVLALSASNGVEWQNSGDGVAEARLQINAGDCAWFALRHDDDEVHSMDDLMPQALLDRTAQWWDTWVAQLAYHGRYRREVERSALALKLLQYEPSGAIVASPTTSLPEWPGGERNWDYRYTWVRDSSFVLVALSELGIRNEASQYLRFFKRVARHADGAHLQVLHSVDGVREVPEQILAHLEGYGGAAPVRIGNGAAHQFQLDIYGELTETLALGHREVAPSEGVWAALHYLLEWVAQNWREKDWGVWEARQGPRHYVFGKVMAWRALERGIWLAQHHGLSGDTGHWSQQAEAIRNEVLDRGWDPARGTFLQSYDEPHLDAAVLVIPKIRFLKRSDPRVRSTLEAIRRELSAGPEELIYRYRSPDGLAGDEGAFIICSFWMIENLAMVGELDEAERLFGLLLRRASRVGLFAEEIDPRTGDFLGNHPLGLSHAALINTAVVLDRLRERAG